MYFYLAMVGFEPYIYIYIYIYMVGLNQIRTGAVKRPPCSNFALLNDHFSISLVV